jgi:two-component system, cell cycle sensor histidine kinase and response regulator CckA
MPEGGELRIGLSNRTLGRGAELPAGEYVQLLVSDTGSGMSADTLERLFEPFFTTKERAAGLGLATVRGVVRHAGGRIRVDSEPGQGASFEILWPRAPAAATSATRGSVFDVPADTRPRTILLAEDDDAVRQLAGRVLERRGHRVIAARNGEEALAAAAEHPDIDLLIADIIMPGMSGLELGHSIRERIPSLPVLYTSGYAGGAFLSEAEMPVGTAFLEKPFHPADLVARAETLLLAST